MGRKSVTASILFYAITLMAGLVCVLVALLIPVHFGAISRDVLRVTGEGSESVEELAAVLLEFNRVGAAAEVIRSETWLPVDDVVSAHQRQQTLERLTAQRQRDISEQPRLQLTGRPDPYFESWLSLLQQRGLAPAADPETTPTVYRFLAGSAQRALLLDFLAQSTTPAVQGLLATRDLTGMARFMPVGTPGGGPLDATILTTALLVQSGHLDASVGRQILRFGEAARDGNDQAAAQAESFYLGMLALINRFNWGQLTELTRHTRDWTDIPRLAHALRHAGDRQPLLFTATLLAERPAAVTHYLDSHPETDAYPAMAVAMADGRAALLLLLERNEPIYQTPVWLEPITGLRNHPVVLPLVSWAANHPGPAMLVKLGLLLLGMFCFGWPWRRKKKPQAGSAVSGWHPLLLGHRLTVGVVLVMLTIALTEPTLFAKALTDDRPTFQLDFSAFATTTALPEESTMNLSGLDPISLLALLIFFFIQVIIYLLCLIKVAEIRRQSLSPKLKIKLLENEDNLFDSGLYVGLGGTVISLIMLTLGIVEASLVAAYASTLFGIIFVAIIKIFHVRPYRRKLLVEIESQPQAQTGGGVRLLSQSR
jgi:hypothetical protein